MAGRGMSRILRPLALLTGLALAAAATAALVLTEDLQMLRLAVIAALWAFLIAAFVAGQRRSGGDTAGVAEPQAEVVLRRTYELEREREIADRREFKLRTEVQLRRELEGRMREDMAALRGDLVRLRHDILERWDGELRVERIAVRAESTRVSGFGATFHALQDEARRLGAEGHPLFEVEGAPPPEQLDTASTVEFSVVPAAPATSEVTPEATPEGAAPYPPEVPRAAAEPPIPARPAVAAFLDTDPFAQAQPLPGTESGRRRTRHGEEEPSVDVSALMRRLEAEEPARREGAPRRRRYRDDDETNDVLARVLRG